jgi:hypothetical protein
MPARFPNIVLAAATICLAGCAPAASEERTVSGAQDPIHRDSFDADTENWIAEQQPGGTVRIGGGTMVIDDAGGCTVWFRKRLHAPVRIVCELALSSAARVSDMNFFWMATDPRHPDDLFAHGHGRTGKFATYDTLRTYYVGYGGNTNSTTRFRRYDGTGKRPLLPEHDLNTPEFLLEGDHVYRVELVAANGRAQFIRDGEVIFDFEDPEPLVSGWFGFRTVHSRIEVHSFAVFREPAVP